MSTTAGVAPQLHFPAGSAVDGSDPVVITPKNAGWRYTGLRVIELDGGGMRELATQHEEMLVVPMVGACVVEVDGSRFELTGRASVFDRVTDFVYLPIDADVRISSRSGGSFALPSARAERRFSAAYGAAESVAVEVRGAGASTRQLNNFFAPGVMEADRLAVVEVLTPGGNTSSYPPHKHDRVVAGGEAELEEIYYYRFASAQAFGLHRTYDAGGAFDVTATVRDGDVFLVPRGYHGPCSAVPGYDMYYLNVLAGPGAERSLAFSDDPSHAWIRHAWSGQAPDRRVPMTSARGRTR